MTLTKEVKDLYDKNFKSLKKETKEDLRRWKDLPCLRIRTWNMARKLKIMENEKHPLDDLKNDEITKKREK